MDRDASLRTCRAKNDGQDASHCASGTGVHDDGADVLPRKLG